MFESIHKKVVDRGDLKKIRGGNLKKKIVICCGCFDILHSNHAIFLNECKKYGDILVVSVASDLWIRTNKGSNRPINKEQDRVHLVAAMEDVDYAILGERKWDSESLIDFMFALKEIKPDVLVACTDNGIVENSSVDLERLCKENSMELVILESEVPEYLTVTSTTDIISRV